MDLSGNTSARSSAISCLVDALTQPTVDQRTLRTEGPPRYADCNAPKRLELPLTGRSSENARQVLHRVHRVLLVDFGAVDAGSAEHLVCGRVVLRTALAVLGAFEPRLQVVGPGPPFSRVALHASSTTWSFPPPPNSR